MNWKLISICAFIAIFQLGLLHTAYNLGRIKATLECINIQLDSMLKKQN